MSCCRISFRYYTISIPLMEINHKDKYVENTIDESLLDFLKKC